MTFYSYDRHESLAGNPTWAFAANARPAEPKPVVYEDSFAKPSPNDVAAERLAKFAQVWADHELDVADTLSHQGAPTLEEARQRDQDLLDQAILGSGRQATGGTVEYPANPTYL